MKTVSVRDLQKRVKACVDEAQRDRMVITRRGQPAALIIGVEGLDWEDIVLGSDPKFWAMIEARRKEKTISLDEMKARLKAKAKAESTGGRRRARGRWQERT
jgi:prevent-host-death family protein